MKNLMINQDFIAKAALLDGDETKQLLLWCYNYAVNDLEPTKEEFNKAHFSVCIAFNEMKPYLNYCNYKYDNKSKPQKTEEIKVTSNI